MYDVLIIGAGVTGSAVARELSRYQLNIAVLEKEEDVCAGTSKANSGIVHAGFDAMPGSKKARMNVRGNLMMEELSQKLKFPFRRNGSLVLCFAGEDRKKLEILKDQGEKNGVEGLRILEKEEVLAMEPSLSQKVEAALFAPTGGIVCPFQLNIALAENAAENGVTFFFGETVQKIKPLGKNCGEFSDDAEKEIGFSVRTDNHHYEAAVVVNCAGVYGDVFHNQVSENRIQITPRKGEYCLLDKKAGNLVSHTVFQLPSEKGKGVLVTPTVHGNLLLGPTAEDIEDKEGIDTTREGLNKVLRKASESVPNLPLDQIITSFAGLRAHEAGNDFILGEAKDVPGFFDAVGIESPGLTSAPAIGEWLSERIVLRLLESRTVKKKKDWIATRRDIPFMAEAGLEEAERLIAENPAYGNVICRCEHVTEGEILDAIHRPLGARSLDGIKRRTRAGMGRCQSGFCSTKVMEILCRELSIPPEEVTKMGGGSVMLKGGER
jgi:glycerol-3-phosphate dehydrogenase